MLTISLGSGSDTFTIQSTHSGTTALNADGGDDTVNVCAIAGLTTIHASDGDDTINVSSDAPDNTGTLDAIQGTLNIEAGRGSNTLRISDIADTTPDGTVSNPVVITDHSIVGFSPGDITYTAKGGSFAGGITTEGGSGGNTIDIQSTHETPGVQTMTVVNTGQGDDRLTVSETDPHCLVVNAQGGNDWVDASASKRPVTLIGGPGNDTLIGGSGRDKLDGGDGMNVVEKRSSNDAAPIDEVFKENLNDLFEDFTMEPNSWIKPFVTDISQALGSDNPNAGISVTLPGSDDKGHRSEKSWFKKLLHE